MIRRQQTILAHGQFHSSTLSHFLNQYNSPATRDQNLSGSFTDSLYRCSYSSRLLMCACRAKSGGQSNLRCSCRMESMLVDFRVNYSFFGHDEAAFDAEGNFAGRPTANRREFAGVYSTQYRPHTIEVTAKTLLHRNLLHKPGIGGKQATSSFWKCSGATLRAPQWSAPEPPERLVIWISAREYSANGERRMLVSA